MGGTMDYLKSNPGTVPNVLSAFAPMFGASSLSAPLRTMGGVADLATVGSRNDQYTKDRPAADAAVNAYKNASAEDKQSGKVPAPTPEQYILAAGGGIPAQKDQLARGTIADVGVMGQDAAKRRAASSLQASQAAKGLAPTVSPMTRIPPTSMFTPPQSGSNSADTIVRLLAAMKQQQAAPNPWKVT